MDNVYIASCAPDGGIYFCKNNHDGTLRIVQKTEADRPMFLAIDGGRLYALLRAPFDSCENSGLISYDINPNGTLSNPSEILSTDGEVACHLTVANGCVYCANYISGSVKKFPDKLVTHKGHGPHPTRQTAAHTHFVTLSPTDQIFVCDLGLDKIFVYDKDLNEEYTISTPNGSGARHLAFLGDMMYCVNELSSTVSVFKKSGERYEYLADYPALPSDFKGENTAAAIRIQDGFLYISNRGHNSIAAMKIEGDTLGSAAFTPCGGDFPRDMNICGDYMFCANQYSKTVTSLKIGKNGKLSPTDFVMDIADPLCIIFN